ncbi:hypothetical protein GN958_ATG06034 [Phytophthora infestans]|uniref:Uncharacterized protein n=1 Tax=Phytophthora infestans TaxID=4787 RepID=A0A8S9UV20_PHYIN|nr:hypothetical protein GN958_ATG06034 [Phytophthora infestans]
MALAREMEGRKIDMKQARFVAQSQAEERMQILRQESEHRNRQLVFDCVKAVSEAFGKRDLYGDYCI